MTKYSDIEIKKYPYLSYSQNLFEAFYIIGYEEEDIQNEIIPNIQRIINSTSRKVRSKNSQKSFFFQKFNRDSNDSVDPETPKKIDNLSPFHDDTSTNTSIKLSLPNMSIQLQESDKKQIDKNTSPQNNNEFLYKTHIEKSNNNINTTPIKMTNNNDNINDNDIQTNDNELQDSNENKIGNFEPYFYRVKPTIINEISVDQNKILLENDIIIELNFPDPPIIYYSDSSNNNIPTSYSVVFYTNSDTLDEKGGGCDKLTLHGYTYVFYQLHSLHGYNFYIPTSFSILSQFPFFCLYNHLCKTIVDFFKKPDLEIPLEILIYNLINFTPSPINNSLMLNLFPYFEISSYTNFVYSKNNINNQAHEISNSDNITNTNNTNNANNINTANNVNNNNINNAFNSILTIPEEYKSLSTSVQQISGYPIFDFNLSQLFKVFSIQTVIKILIFNFLEIQMLFFSKDIEKLNISMYIISSLSYPCNDSIYLWHILSVSKSDLMNEDTNNHFIARPFTHMIGVTCSYSDDIDLSHVYPNSFIVDLDHNKFFYNSDKKKRKVCEEANDIHILSKYIDDIFNNRVSDSFFLDKYIKDLVENLCNCAKKLKQLFNFQENDQQYLPQFFEIEALQVNTNRKIQEAFYDFVLNILKTFANFNKYKGIKKKKDYNKLRTSLMNPSINIQNHLLNFSNKINSISSKKSLTNKSIKNLNSKFNKFMGDEFTQSKDNIFDNFVGNLNFTKRSSLIEKTSMMSQSMMLDFKLGKKNKNKKTFKNNHEEKEKIEEKNIEEENNEDEEIKNNDNKEEEVKNNDNKEEEIKNNDNKEEEKNDNNDNGNDNNDDLLGKINEVSEDKDDEIIFRRNVVDKIFDISPIDEKDEIEEKVIVCEPDNYDIKTNNEINENININNEINDKNNNENIKSNEKHNIKNDLLRFNLTTIRPATKFEFNIDSNLEENEKKRRQSIYNILDELEDDIAKYSEKKKDIDLNKTTQFGTIAKNNNSSNKTEHNIDLIIQNFRLEKNIKDNEQTVSKKKSINSSNKDDEKDNKEKNIKDNEQTDSTKKCNKNDDEKDNNNNIEENKMNKSDQGNDIKRCNSFDKDKTNHLNPFEQFYNDEEEEENEEENDNDNDNDDNLYDSEENSDSSNNDGYYQLYSDNEDESNENNKNNKNKNINSINDNATSSKYIKYEVNENRFSKEEKIFYKMFKDSSKFTNYILTFLQTHKCLDLYKIPLLFSEEFINLKNADEKKFTNNFFNMMKSYYSKVSMFSKRRRVNKPFINLMINDNTNANDNVDQESEINMDIASNSNNNNNVSNTINQNVSINFINFYAYYDKNLKEKIFNFKTDNNIKKNKIMNKSKKSSSKYTYEYKSICLDQNLINYYVYYLSNLTEIEINYIFPSIQLKNEIQIENVKNREISNSIERYLLLNKIINISDIIFFSMVLMYSMFIREINDEGIVDLYIQLFHNRKYCIRKYITIILASYYRIIEKDINTVLSKTENDNQDKDQEEKKENNNKDNKDNKNEDKNDNKNEDKNDNKNKEKNANINYIIYNIKKNLKFYNRFVDFLKEKSILPDEQILQIFDNLDELLKKINLKAYKKINIYSSLYRNKYGNTNIFSSNKLWDKFYLSKNYCYHGIIKEEYFFKISNNLMYEGFLEYNCEKDLLKVIPLLNIKFYNNKKRNHVSSEIYSPLKLYIETNKLMESYYQSLNTQDLNYPIVKKLLLNLVFYTLYMTSSFSSQMNNVFFFFMNTIPV